MKVKIDAKKREITIIASGNERKAINLIVAFAGYSIKNVNNNLLSKITSSFINTIKINMDSDIITKEFIQLLLRMK